MRKIVILFLLLNFGLKAQMPTYSVISIPYSFYALPSSAFPVGNADDSWQIPFGGIGFLFNYFGVNTWTVAIGANGQVSFFPTIPPGDGWQINNALPNSTDMLRSTICVAFRDIKPPLGGTIKCGTYGTAPYRFFVTTWDNIPLFNKGTGICDSTANSTFQVILYETCNIIDVNISKSDSCVQWNGAYGIIGIQDSSGTVGYSPPGRNYPNVWKAINESWRFTPSGSTPCIPLDIQSVMNKKGGVELYPNPNNGSFNIFVGDEINDPEIILYDIVGHQVHEHKLEHGVNAIKADELSKGLYYYSIYQNKQQYCRGKIRIE